MRVSDRPPQLQIHRGSCPVRLTAFIPYIAVTAVSTNGAGGIRGPRAGSTHVAGRTAHPQTGTSDRAIGSSGHAIIADTNARVYEDSMIPSMTGRY